MVYLEISMKGKTGNNLKSSSIHAVDFSTEFHGRDGLQEAFDGEIFCIFRYPKAKKEKQMHVTYYDCLVVKK